jgi:hypothetical protein
MSGTQWHGLIVELEDPDDPDSEVLHELMHPSSCPWSVLWHPRIMDTLGNVKSEAWTERRHECSVSADVDNFGWDDFPQEPGWYWVRSWVEVYPSGPWGPEEYDGGIHWEVVKRPRIDVERIGGAE